MYFKIRKCNINKAVSSLKHVTLAQKHFDLQLSKHHMVCNGDDTFPFQKSSFFANSHSHILCMTESFFFQTYGWFFRFANLPSVAIVLLSFSVSYLVWRNIL